MTLARPSCSSPITTLLLAALLTGCGPYTDTTGIPQSLGSAYGVPGPMGTPIVVAGPGPVQEPIAINSDNGLTGRFGPFAFTEGEQLFVGRHIGDGFEVYLVPMKPGTPEIRILTNRDGDAYTSRYQVDLTQKYWIEVREAAGTWSIKVEGPEK